MLERLRKITLGDAVLASLAIIVVVLLGWHAYHPPVPLDISTEQIRGDLLVLIGETADDDEMKRVYLDAYDATTRYAAEIGVVCKWAESDDRKTCLVHILVDGDKNPYKILDMIYTRIDVQATYKLKSTDLIKLGTPD